MTQEQAYKTVLELEKRYKNSPLNGIQILSELTDAELTAFIAIDTHNYGREWDDSLENALIHIENREQAIRLFGTSQSDLLGAH